MASPIMRSSPCTRNAGGSPPSKCRSDAPSSFAFCTRDSSTLMAGLRRKGATNDGGADIPSELSGPLSQPLVRRREVGVANRPGVALQVQREPPVLHLDARL